MPVLLLARREWRALGAFAAVSAGLAALSLALVGWWGAAEYVAFLTSDAYRSDVAAAIAWRMLSVPALVRAVVPGVPDIVIVAVAVAGLSALAWAVRRAAPARAFAAAVLVSVAIDPHCFLYDGLVLAVPILLGVGNGTWGIPRLALVSLWVLTWAMAFRDEPRPGTPGWIPWVVLPLLALVAASLHKAITSGGRTPSDDTDRPGGAAANSIRAR